MPSATYEVFRQAIVERKQVLCFFGGYPRELCPHALGYKDGKEQVLSFQFAGGGKTPLPVGGDWRCMPISGISGASLREGPWHTGSKHSRMQTCVERIEFEVSY